MYLQGVRGAVVANRSSRKVSWPRRPVEFRSFLGTEIQVAALARRRLLCFVVRQDCIKLRSRVAAGRGQARRANAQALERVLPQFVAGHRIETIHVPLHRHDQPVAVQQDDRQPAALGAFPFPNQLARLSIERHDARVESSQRPGSPRLARASKRTIARWRPCSFASREGVASRDGDNAIGPANCNRGPNRLQTCRRLANGQVPSENRRAEGDRPMSSKPSKNWDNPRRFSDRHSDAEIAGLRQDRRVGDCAHAGCIARQGQRGQTAEGQRAGLGNEQLRRHGRFHQRRHLRRRCLQTAR